MFKALETVSAIGALVMAATPLLAVGGVARAQDMAPQTIRVADLDLSQASDRARFDARVDRAADRMCAGGSEIIINAACRQAVRDEAAEKLQALHAEAATPERTAVAATFSVAGR